jgi:apolipoprotein D and lipocalin family protein
MRRTAWRIAVVLAMAAGAAHAQPAAAVDRLDLGRFTGTWFEIARLPDKAQKHCVGGAFDMYTLGDKPGRFTLLTSCKLKDGTAQVRNLSGRRGKNSVDGKLKVTTLWPFSRKIWVLALAPDYGWALVGSQNHKTLWLLSRTATMAPDALQQAQAKAASEGFHIEKLETVPQTP